MKVKDFIEMVKDDATCVVELDLPERRENDRIIRETKTSAYDDLSEYYEWMVVGFRKIGLAPIYQIHDALYGTNTAMYTHAYRLAIR